MTTKIYLVSKADILKLEGGDAILQELTVHREYTSSEIEWPNTFYVTINLESEDDTNGIQYFKSVNVDTETPFLIMGYSDIPFMLTAAFLKLIGNILIHYSLH